MKLGTCAIALTIAAALSSGCAAHVVRADGPIEQAVVKDLPMKDPGAAAAMSFIIPGAGQAYYGDLPGAYLTAIRQGVCLALVITAPSWGKEAGIFGVLFFGLAYLLGSGYAAEDAYLGAERHNRRVAELRLAITEQEKKAAASR